MQSSYCQIQSDYAEVAKAAGTILEICEGYVLDEIKLFHIELAVVEAANNCIEHAYLDQPNKPIEVSSKLENGKLNIAIADVGRSIPEGTIENTLDYKSIEDANVDRDTSSGRGINLLKSISDGLAYQTAGGKNTLTIVFNLPEK